MQFILRPAKLSDAPALAEVNRAAWQGAYAGLFSERFLSERFSGAEDRFASLLSRSPDYLSLWVAQADDAPVGFVCVRPEGRSEDLEGSELTSIYIHPDYQRMGAGSLLLSAALRESEGRPSLYLWVFERNLAALSFYHAKGFAPDGGFCQWHPGNQGLMRLVKSL